jgi:hypothetical protein
MKLIGKSQKGKNRVRELGGEWLKRDGYMPEAV